MSLLYGLRRNLQISLLHSQEEAGKVDSIYRTEVKKKLPKTEKNFLIETVVIRSLSSQACLLILTLFLYYYFYDISLKCNLYTVKCTNPSGELGKFFYCGKIHVA